MIVVDTSALIAMLAREPEHQRFLTVLDGVERRLVSAVTYYEAGIVMRARAGQDGQSDLDDLLHEIDAEIVPFDGVLAKVALDAYSRFGKGIHPARLNLGDCASYALAKSMNAPLLFKGGDFTHTDVVAAG